MIHSQLSHWKFNNKRVFLRADLNVPLQNGRITNDFRLTAILPTLNYLLNQNNMVILTTHIGKPKGYEKDLSTSILVPWFKTHGYDIVFATTIKSILAIPFTTKQIVLLENLRFFSGEQSGDPFFAKQLAQTAEYYVNDAFGTIHRNDCSISLLPYEFSENRRTIGFLIEKELRILHQLIHKPKKPFIAILGGNKIKEKIPLIKNLLKTVDKIFLCPALCFSFLKSLNQPIGQSFIDMSMISTCKKILCSAESDHVAMVFPQDYQIAKSTINGPLSCINAAHFPPDAIGISIGPETIQFFTNEIHTAQTIFFNCAMGFSERPETQQGTYSLLHAAAQTKGITIIAGGNTIEAALKVETTDAFDHLSTGGGAALAYLGGNQLPGLVPFEDY